MGISQRQHIDSLTSENARLKARVAELEKSVASSNKIIKEADKNYASACDLIHTLKNDIIELEQLEDNEVSLCRVIIELRNKITELEKANEWYKVDDNIEDKTEWLIYFEDTKEYQAAYHSCSGSWHVSDGGGSCTIDTPSHYKRLPQPPKESE